VLPAPLGVCRRHQHSVLHKTFSMTSAVTVHASPRFEGLAAALMAAVAMEAASAFATAPAAAAAAAAAAAYQ